MASVGAWKTVLLIWSTLFSPSFSQTHIRLAGGNSMKGRVEVYANGAWGTVCDDDWDDMDAKVVCRMLSLRGGNAVSEAYFGQGSGQIFLDDVNCRGHEQSLFDCSHSRIGTHNCGHSEDAGVICGDVRLAGGTGRTTGRVEVNVDGAWGTVCDDDWDDYDAAVVCRMLQIRGGGEAISKAQFGQGSGRILLDNVNCQGNEQSLFDCSHNIIGIHDCSHSEDAGVICGDVNLAGGNGRTTGRVEVKVNGAWGTVCDDGWDNRDAAVVCKMLQISGRGEAVSEAYFGAGSSSSKIVLDEVGCTGEEVSLKSCRSNAIGVHDCSHNEDAGVKCGLDCAIGTFGVNCVEECHCRDSSPCNKTTGICGNSLCAPGYKPSDSTCQTLCDYGTFGLNCLKKCQCHGGGNCSKIDGTCSSGLCQPGYDAKDLSCQTECDDGTFGFNCLQECHCQSSLPCNKVTGYCPDGLCAPGYKLSDNTCQIECDNGTFGFNCSMECHCLNSAKCSQTTGFCPDGLCAQGYSNADPTCQTVSASYIPITAGTVSGAVFLIIIIGIIANYCRRKPSVLCGKTTSLPSLETNVTEMNVYDRGPAKTLVKLENLATYILSQKRCAVPYKDEHEALPKGNVEGQVGNLPENKSKNRFKNIIPYDNSRVVLTMIDNDRTSDYINATYIDGYHTGQVFIATQAPTEQTLEDFWQMLWEQNAECIVMLTALMEENKIKCTKYWSEQGDTMCVGDMMVTTLSEEVFPDYAVRIMEVKKVNELRCLTQFHYTAWKGHGVPDNGNTLLHFHKRVQDMSATSKSCTPIVVHCSGGVGRTGTFIALDYLIEQAKKQGCVDIYSCVSKMRSKRTNMVTRRQYEYLYDTMLEWYTVGVTAVERSEFHQLMQDNRTIQKQFQHLEHVRSNSTHDEGLPESLEPNMTKCRYSKILPVECSQVALTTNTAKGGGNIDAVFVDGYLEKNAFIATHLLHTRADFFQMVWDFGLQVIVNVNNDSKEHLWPKKGKRAIEGSFYIETSASMSYSQRLTVYDVTLTNEGTPLDIQVLQYNDFKQNEENIADLLEIYSTVREWKQSLQCESILVQCLYGVEFCGLFIALWNIIEMINCESEVDVCQTVRRIRTQRPEFIQNLEEYSFLCKAVGQYLENEDNLYADVA